MEAMYGEDYIEPFTQMPLAKLQLEHAWPSEDGRRLYDLPSLFDYINQATTAVLDPITKEAISDDYIKSTMEEEARLFHLFELHAHRPDHTD